MPRNNRLLVSLLGVIIILLFAILINIFVPAPTTNKPQTPPPGRPGVGDRGRALTPGAQEPHWGVQTKTSGCRVNGPLQDTACTPGAIFADATTDEICTPGYASSVRNVPQSVKREVYDAYDIVSRRPGQYEIDHLVSLQLGGSNDIANLWPEAARPTPGFHEKDRVETYLHDEVCDGQISLKDAQIEIATNWLSVYERMPAYLKSPDDSGEGAE